MLVHIAEPLPGTVVVGRMAIHLFSQPHVYQLDHTHDCLPHLVAYLVFFFFFQAEDGIRDVAVTGVQTCALPISTPGLPAACCLPCSSAATAMPALSSSMSLNSSAARERVATGAPSVAAFTS